LVREWGRIDSPGILPIDPFETLEESERALRRIEKQTRCYVLPTFRVSRLKYPGVRQDLIGNIPR
jgi:hypothetical protein